MLLQMMGWCMWQESTAITKDTKITEVKTPNSLLKFFDKGHSQVRASHHSRRFEHVQYGRRCVVVVGLTWHSTRHRSMGLSLNPPLLTYPDLIISSSIQLCCSASVHLKRPPSLRPTINQFGQHFLINPRIRLPSQRWPWICEVQRSCHSCKPPSPSFNTGQAWCVPGSG